LAVAVIVSALLAAEEAAGQTPTDQNTLGGPARSAKKPPAVRIEVDTASDGETAMVCVHAEDRGGGVGRVELTADGESQKASDRNAGRDVSGEECPLKAWEFNVTLVPGTNRLRAIAWNADTTAFTADLASVPGRSPVEAGATLHILAIGINSYAPPLRLSYAVNDARVFADSLERLARPLFGSRVRVIHDTVATRRSIERHFLRLADAVGKQDTFVFFFAGHGTIVNVGRDSVFFLAGVDATSLTDKDHLATTGVSDDDLAIWLSRIDTRRKLLVLDACKSGEIVRSLAGKDPIGYDVIDRGLGRVAGILAAAGPAGQARASGALGHGLYTAALLQNNRGATQRPEVININRWVAQFESVLRALYTSITPKGEKSPPLPPRTIPSSDFDLMVR
jgi:hypothetical protein